MNTNLKIMSTLISLIFRRFLRKPNVSEASDQFGMCIQYVINFKIIKTNWRQHKMKFFSFQQSWQKN